MASTLKVPAKTHKRTLSSLTTSTQGRQKEQKPYQSNSGGDSSEYLSEFSEQGSTVSQHRLKDKAVGYDIDETLVIDLTKTEQGFHYVHAEKGKQSFFPQQDLEKLPPHVQKELQIADIGETLQIPNMKMLKTLSENCEKPDTDNFLPTNGNKPRAETVLQTFNIWPRYTFERREPTPDGKMSETGFLIPMLDPPAEAYTSNLPVIRPDVLIPVSDQSSAIYRQMQRIYPHNASDLEKIAYENCMKHFSEMPYPDVVATFTELNQKFQNGTADLNADFRDIVCDHLLPLIEEKRGTKIVPDVNIMPHEEFKPLPYNFVDAIALLHKRREEPQKITEFEFFDNDRRNNALLGHIAQALSDQTGGAGLRPELRQKIKDIFEKNPKLTFSYVNQDHLHDYHDIKGSESK